LELLTRRGTLDQNAGNVVCWPGRQLHIWNSDENGVPVPGDSNPFAEFTTDTQGRWFIRNLWSDRMKVVSPHQKAIAKGTQELLVNGTMLLLAGLASSRLARFAHEIVGGV